MVGGLYETQPDRQVLSIAIEVSRSSDARRCSAVCAGPSSGRGSVYERSVSRMARSFSAKSGTSTVMVNRSSI